MIGYGDIYIYIHTYTRTYIYYLGMGSYDNEYIGFPVGSDRRACGNGVMW